ncbi:DUF2798 domain-containing protein [Vibrio sp. MA40-2]|uniref:DUF2798 domain-containing protein n=1 Tax=Vibrio sp. MA40-2 TaxID=3391828 RepID=UPI0039A478AA
MGKNKFENFIFSVMVCYLMVLGMTLYNDAVLSSRQIGVMTTLASLEFVAIFMTAFILDWFLVAPVVKKLVNTFTDESTPFLMKILYISGLMVLLMCAAMSLVATLVQGYDGSLLTAYGKAFAFNFVFALPLQFLLVGPIVRTAFFKMFPVAIAH